MYHLIVILSMSQPFALSPDCGPIPCLYVRSRLRPSPFMPLIPNYSIYNPSHAGVVLHPLSMQRSDSRVHVYLVVPCHRLSSLTKGLVFLPRRTQQLYTQMPNCGPPLILRTHPHIIYLVLLLFALLFLHIFSLLSLGSCGFHIGHISFLPG